ncbi:MAG: class I SAM-dependent methyltransferase [Verrucomicrobiaceae bacterium]|nr:class I SAM-dependent methyltransferase [Verrucomicrobiaceae bacterium]
MVAHHPPANATSRFSNRVADYVRYRPGYPEGVLTMLRDHRWLKRGARAADIGSGTGIFSSLLLGEGAEVFAVEPNADMREAAETILRHHALFHSIAASGEETTLAGQSMDLIVSAQAFHWLDRTRARCEFTRLLKPGGRVVLIWNVRQTDCTPFLRDYEQLLLNFAPDYAQVRHENVDAEALTSFFTDGVFEKHAFANQQSFDFAGLRGRLLSSSYAPAEGHPLHDPMIQELRRLFEAHEQNGTVDFLYATEVFIGR